MRHTLIGLLALMVACEEPGGLDGTGTALEQCSTDPIDPVFLSEMSIDGSTLTLDASYGGGCEEHAFQLCWDGSVMESDPVQINVALIHDGNGDSCEAEVTETLSFDLSTAGLSGQVVMVNIGDESLEYTAE